MKHLTTSIKESLLSDFDTLSRENEHEMMWNRLVSISTFPKVFEELRKEFDKNLRKASLDTEISKYDDQSWNFKKKPSSKKVYIIFQQKKSKPGQGDAIYHRLWIGRISGYGHLCGIYTYGYDAQNIEIMTPNKALRQNLSAIEFDKTFDTVEIYELPEEYMWIYNRIMNM